jgi:TRAP-type uncharacterized transport system substrate-binding protein
MNPIDLKIIGAGSNWLNLSHVIALNLNGYNSPLGKESTISITTMDPGIGSMESPRMVGEGRFDIGVTTPGWYGALAYEGRAPFAQPQPIRGLALLPHDDRMVFVARKDTGITSIRQIIEEKRPLRYSIPTSDTHPAIYGADEVLAAYGTSRAQLDAWGGIRLRDRPRFQIREDAKPVADDWEIVFDEAIMTPRWKNLTKQYEVTFLGIDEDVLAKLEARGLKRAVIEKERFPQALTADVPTVDFSGWLIHCRASLPDEVAYLVAKVIDENRDAFAQRIPPHSGLTHPIDPAVYVPKMPIPLHPGAEQYYREHGYVK